MRVSVQHQGLVDLQRDLSEIPVQMVRQGSRLILDNARNGGQTARRVAKWTAGRHGKHYPKSITWDRSLGIGTAFGAMRAEYGPDSSLPQGGMSFENGSRKQKPHNDLLHSLDIIRPKFHRDVEAMLNSLFWPGGDR